MNVPQWELRNTSSHRKGSAILSSHDMMPSELESLLNAASYLRRAPSSCGIPTSSNHLLKSPAPISGETVNDTVFQSSCFSPSSWIVAGATLVDNANRHSSTLSEKTSALSAIAKDLETSFEGAKQMLDAAESRAMHEKAANRGNTFLKRLEAIIAEAASSTDDNV